MTAGRAQHLILSAIILLTALTVGWLSFTREPAAAFLFPRLISIAFILLAVWNFVRAALGLAKTGGGIDRTTLVNLLPGVVVMAIYILLGARNLGFYAASTITFLVLYSIYDPAPLTSVRDWLKRVAISLAFMAIIYILFALTLQVQTPRGILM